MEKIIQEFHNQFRKTALSTSLNTVQGFHIFRDIFNLCSGELTPEDKMAMWHMVLKYEKSLEEARAGNIHQSKYWIDYVNDFQYTLPANAEKGLSNLYHAMFAYYEYVLKRYDSALHNLKEAQMIANSLMENPSFAVIFTVKLEQYLNIVRVLFSLPDKDAACREAGKLLLVAITGVSKTELFVPEHLGYIKLIEPEKVKVMQHHITDSIIMRAGREIRGNEEKERTYYRQILADVWAETDWRNCLLENYRLCITALEHYYAGRSEAFLLDLKLALTDLSDIPKKLQIFVFDKVKSTARENNYPAAEELCADIDEYYNTILEPCRLQTT
ncbi:MAG: hypothetical protein JNM68_17115 [Dinghuibacter sp.]|nr:hypothetical protein [Dinghuibacter sp.]